MQLSTLKNSFLSLTLVAIASVPSGLLTACSTTTSQNQASNPTTTATDTSDKQPMNYGGSMNHSMTMDLGSADANYDLRFIDAMIPHHQGAVEMANVAQEKSKRPEIKKLAEEIISSQDKEIAELKQWRKAWYPRASSTPVAYDAKTGKTVSMPLRSLLLCRSTQKPQGRQETHRRDWLSSLLHERLRPKCSYAAGFTGRCA